MSWYETDGTWCPRCKRDRARCCCDLEQRTRAAARVGQRVNDLNSGKTSIAAIHEKMTPAQWGAITEANRKKR